MNSNNPFNILEVTEDEEEERGSKEKVQKRPKEVERVEVGK